MELLTAPRSRLRRRAVAGGLLFPALVGFAGLVGLLAAAPLAAQDQSADWYLDKPIAGVRFLGLRHVAEGDLRPIYEPYLEQPFTLDLFWELQGELYATDLFASLESNAVAPNGDRSRVIVEFAVQERPLVGTISVTGNDRLSSTEILDAITLARGDRFDPVTLDADRAAVTALYVGKGYPDAVVTTATTPDAEAGLIDVAVAVSEGYGVNVERIQFAGNEFASDSTLRGRMLTKERSLFESGAFREAALQEDLLIIAAYYASHGYPDAAVERVEREQRLDEEQGRRLLTLTLHVAEGEQYTYGGMSFEGNEVFSTEELSRLVRHRADEPVNRAVVDADFARVQDHYFENGYIFNAIRLVEERDEQARSIGFRVLIQEAERAHIENIILSGNERTQDHVLLRELPFEVGDVFNKTQILQGLRNLYNTQYFSAVTPDTPAGSAEGLMDVVVTVEEQSTADVNFGLTIGGSDFPLAARVLWNERNLGGGGQTVGAALELSPIRQSLTAEFVEPWLFGQRWSGGVSLGVERSVVRGVLQDILPPVFSDPAIAAPDPYHTKEEWESDDEPVAGRYDMEYSEWDLSVGVTTRYSIPTAMGFVRFSGGLASTLRFLTYDTAIYRPFDKTVRDEREQWVIINRLDAGVAWDARDFYLNPSEGFLLSQGVSFTGGLLHGARHFIRLNTRADGFLTLLNEPVFTNWDLQVVLAGHAGFAVILPQFWWPADFDSGLVIDSATDLLLIDGIRNARGWDPIRGGRARWENSLELRVPIDPRVLWAVTFLDGAVLWPRLERMTLSLDQFHFSMGAGLRFAIPQFPIRLYFANTFRITDQPQGPEDTLEIFSLEEWKFVISLGGDVF